MTCHEAKGENKDGNLWPVFLQGTSISSRCVPNLNSVPRPKHQDKKNRLLSQKGWGYISIYIYLWSALGVVACQGLSLSLLQSCEIKNTRSSDHQRQMIKGYPTGGSCKNQGTVHKKTGTPNTVACLKRCLRSGTWQRESSNIVFILWGLRKGSQSAPSCVLT